MKCAAMFVMVAAAFALPAQAQTYGQYGVGGAANGNSYGPTAHEAPPSDDARPVSRDAMAVAEDMRLKGHCDRAVPILRRFAERGAGYEIAQFNLGLCLLELAGAEADPAQAKSMREEGAQWTLRSANAGFAKAQAKAVVLYLDAVGVAADPVEAEKWALLYHSNVMRFTIGLRDISDDLRKRIDTQLTDATRAQAEALARDWTPASSDSGEEQ